MKRTIKKITVQTGGLKGLILEGREDVAKDNKITEDGFKLTKRHPINADLEDKLKEFRFFALDICGLITDETRKAEKVTLLEGCDVLSIEFEGGVTGYFKIKVASRVFDTKTITLTTPKTDSSDGYEYFDTVMNVIESLLEEVEQYEKGLKKISDEDLMISYIRHGKDKSMDMDKLNEMSAEEKADYCQGILEKLGCLVIRPDEVYEEGETEEVSLETKVVSAENELFDASNMNLVDKEESNSIPEGEGLWPMLKSKPNIEPLTLEIAEKVKLKK
ncbi:hypothetical protein [uncultured Clostridium sp.]|uniref:hypothetical protein n=1 Tax=uncultured Clostridium sp. TaxID=59620 RepID=UPI002634C6F6|nr:hypothetical protein [uncultured Clostridium sp.]